MHAHGEDSRLAQMLARELERFRPVSRGAQIYLDPNFAGASETPWETIVYPLAASAHLVFLASPGAAQSTRCQQAVEYWLARHPPDTVTLVLAGGTIRWDEKAGEFDKKVTNALPPALLKVYRSEPPYFDLRRGYPTPGRESGATRLDTISRLGPRVFGCPWEDLMSACMDAQWCAESEVHDVRGELSLLRRDPARAVREWVEAYRRRPTFDVLLKLVRTYHHDCLPVVSPCALPFTPLLATWIDEVGLVIVDGSRRSGEGSVVCMDPLVGSMRWSATCPEPLDARSVGTRDGRLYFFTRNADDGTELPAPVAISGFGYGSTGRSLPHRITCFDTGTKRAHHLASVSHPRELAIDRAGRRLAFSEGDGIHLCTLDTRSGDLGLALVRSFERVVMTDPINELVFVESLQALVFCSGEDSQLDASGDAVGLLDLATGEPKWTAKLHDKQVNTINVSPDERRMVSASNDGTIALWDVMDGKLLHRWRVDDLPVRAARFTPSGRRIVSVTETGTQVWDGRSGALLRLIPGACGILVMDPLRERFRVLGTSAVCIDLEATHRIADLNDGGTLIADVAFDADGRHAVAACRSSGWNGFIVLDIYDTRTGTRIAQCKPGVDHVSLYRAGLSTTGRYLLADTGIVSQKEDSNSWRITDTETILFDVRSGAVVGRFTTDKKIALDPKERCCVAVMPDELVFETMDGDRTLMAWPRPPGTVLEIAWHSSGDLLALKVSPKDGEYSCRFLRIDWQAYRIDDSWAAAPVATPDGIFEFDLLEERLYVTGTGDSVLAIEPGSALALEVPANDLGSARTASYSRRRWVQPLRVDQLPHRDPYLHSLDGPTVGAMRSDLLDPSLDISVETERLLNEILGSV